MARNQIDRLYDNGLITENEYRRIRKSKAAHDEQSYDYAISAKNYPSPADRYNSNEIRDRASQRNDAPGTGRTVEFGPSDKSVGRNEIDNRENRRVWPKGTALKGKAPDTVPVGLSRNTKGWPTVAQARRMSANEFHPDWYSEGPTRLSGPEKSAPAK
jgi:hypothetical protein